MSSRSSEFRFFRSWRENPLLLREAGLSRGTPIWRSPWAVVMIITLLYAGTTSALSLYFVTHADFVEPTRWFQHSLRWTRFAVMCLPVWLCAQAWARDREPGIREQIAASRLTLSQLFTAKATIWLLPLILFLLILGMTEFFNILMRHFATEGSPWYREIQNTDATRGEILEWWMVYIGLGLLTSLAGAIFDIALVTRLTLRHFNAPIAFVVTVCAGWALTEGTPILFRWGFNWCMTSGLLAGLDPNWLIRLIPFVAYGPPIIAALIAVAMWWGLRRRVARVYGMDGGESPTN